MPYESQVSGSLHIVLLVSPQDVPKASGAMPHSPVDVSHVPLPHLLVSSLQSVLTEHAQSVAKLSSSRYQPASAPQHASPVSYAKRTMPALPIISGCPMAARSIDTG